MRLLTALWAFSICASALDLRQFKIGPSDHTKREQAAVQMLVDEVYKRTQIWILPMQYGETLSVHPQIFVRRGRGPAEGYRIRRADRHLIIEGNDERGVLFGIGRLLREM